MVMLIITLYIQNMGGFEEGILPPPPPFKVENILPINFDLYNNNQELHAWLKILKIYLLYPEFIL